MLGTSPAMVRGKDTSVEFSGYKEHKIITANARILYEELHGGNGFGRIPGLRFAKADEY